VPLDLSDLIDRFRGPVTTPKNPAYEGRRVLFNTRIRTRPAALCRAADAGDVATAVRFARDAGLPLAVRGGGHHACGFSLAQDGIVVDLGALREVTFDPATGTAVAQAGAGWREIDRATYLAADVEGEAGLPHGYAGPGGDCPTVSNAGYSLGGGYGLLSRRFGLGCDHILEAELVDATGAVLRVTEEEHPDLLWALRGAGGSSFGVVTGLRYRLDLVPKTVVGGVIGWPIDQAEDVFRAYRDLYLGREDDRLSLYLLLTTDPYPEGPPVIVMYGLYVGPPADAEAALAPVRSLGTPLFDSFGPMSYHDLQSALGEEIVYGLQLKWRSGYFRAGGFDDEAFKIMVDAFRRVPSGFSMVRFDLLGGGAIGRVPVDATAFVHRTSLFHLSAISLWEHDADTAANVAWVDDLKEALRPHLSGESYQNYADEDLTDWAAAYHGSNYPRLQQVKARYDPTDLFHHPQTVRLP
jgi:FAD/FMN-containing dehydrogenase